MALHRHAHGKLPSPLHRKSAFCSIEMFLILDENLGFTFTSGRLVNYSSSLPEKREKCFTTQIAQPYNVQLVSPKFLLKSEQKNLLGASVPRNHRENSQSATGSRFENVNMKFACCEPTNLFHY